MRWFASLLAVCLAMLLPPAFGQTRNAPCASTLVDCHGINNPALCAALRRGCGNGSAEKPTGTEAQEEQATDPLRQEGLTELPDCSDDEQVVMLPTCRCPPAGQTGAAGAADGGCDSCTSTGVKLACQKIR